MASSPRLTRDPRPLVISGANVVSLQGRGADSDRSVLLVNGVIAAVEPRGVLESSSWEVLDASGKFVVPGLADMHVHWWEPADWALFVANGVTTVRNLAGAPQHLDLARQVAAAELPGPRLVTASPVVDGVGEDGETIWPGAQVLVHPEKAARLVQRYSGQGYRQIKAYSWLRPDVLCALGRAADDQGLPLTGHCPEATSFEEAMSGGMRCFEHLLGIERGHLLGGRPLSLRRRPTRSIEELRRLGAAANRMDYVAIRRLAARMASEQVWNCPTLVLTNSAQDPKGALSDERLRFERPATRAGWRLTAASGGASPSRARRTRELHAARSKMLSRVVSILHQEGAPLLVGTDSPNPFVFQGSSVHDELAHLAQAGLSPLDALRCATSEAARFLGESRSWGTVETGRRADLLLLDGDPLLDLAVLRRPAAVLVNGFRLFRSDLDWLLRQRLDDRARWSGEPVPGRFSHRLDARPDLQLGEQISQVGLHGVLAEVE